MVYLLENYIRESVYDLGKIFLKHNTKNTHLKVKIVHLFSLKSKISVHKDTIKIIERQIASKDIFKIYSQQRVPTEI